MIVLSLIQNLALLVALAAGYPVLAAHWPERRRGFPLLSGLLFGGVGLVGMLTPVTFAPGIIFDGRSIVLSVAGFVGGPLVALVAALPCAAYRAWLGGVGAGMGVAVIAEAAAVGVAFHYWRRRSARPWGLTELWGFGMAVHLVMMALTVLLPAEVRPQVWRQIGLPVVGIYPLAMMLICRLFLDYEQQRKDRAALQADEARYRTTLHSIGDAVIVTDLEGRVELVNPVAEALTGWRQEEARGRPLAEVFRICNEQTRQPVAHPVERVLREGRVVGLGNHTVLQSRDGTERPIADSGAPIRDARNQITGVVLVFRDQTAERAAQQALRASEERYRSLVEQSPDIIGIFQENHLLYLNATGARALGAKCPEEVLGGTSEELIHPDDRAAAAERIRRRLAGETGIYPAEVRYLRRDGSALPVEVSAVPITYGGKPAIQFLARDITERKRAEQALRERESHLQAILSATADGILAVDLQGRVLHYNQRFAEMWRIPRVVLDTQEDQQLLASVLDQLTAPEAFLAKVRELYQSEQTSTDLLTFKDGRLFERYSAPLRQDGRVCGRVWSFRDITRTKELEAQFLRAQRLEGLGALAGGIAHDLNNILSPILMSTSLLRETVQSAENRRMIQTIEACAQRGADIIKQLLAFARGRPGARVPLPVRHLLNDMDRIVRETFPRNIQSRTEAPKDLWPVLADATQIHQALMNLCVNARDAMPGGGTLTLAAANVTLDAAFAAAIPGAKPGQYVCVTVADTGTGIAPEHLDRIFDPFFTTKEVGKGTGLGLPTVLGIVRGHGGFVQVSSQLHQGTTFALYLPASPEASVTETLRHEPPLPRGHGELILLVDDEAPVREAIQRTLQEHGYEVLAAQEGQAALALFTQHRDRIRAVLTDMMMPGMDGPALVRALRGQDARLPILGMTGLASRSSMEGLERLGLAILLSKPFVSRELLTALQTALGGPPATSG